MKHLGERHFGFDKERLGFPSTSACRAIVFQTANGLFGFHNLGNNTEVLQLAAAKEFASYVFRHSQRGSGIHMYAATRIIKGGSYFQQPSNKTIYGQSIAKQFQAEIEIFAKELQYKRGPISAFDLSLKGTTSSSYVEFRAVGRECIVFVKDWHMNNERDGVTKGNSVGGEDHQANSMLKNLPPQVIVDVDPSELVKVDTYRLRT